MGLQPSQGGQESKYLTFSASAVLDELGLIQRSSNTEEGSAVR